MNPRKEAVLGGIRRGLKGRPAAPAPARPPEPEPADPEGLAGMLAGRLADVAATCERVADAGAVPAALRRHLGAEACAGKIACSADVAGIAWGGEGLDVSPAHAPADCEAAVTGALCAVAETGSLVVTSAVPGGLEASLLPARHVCVLEKGRIVRTVGEAVGAVLSAGPGLPRSFSFVTGPSVTADIEQTLVRGAHGPLGLHVIIVG